MPELLESVELPLPLEPLLPEVLPEPPVLLELEPLLLCFFLVLEVLLPEPPLPVALEPAEPELPAPIESEALPEPLVVDEPDALVPLVPPLVEPPDCANAAPAASIEITANRFHHVFCMRKRSR